MKRVSLLTAALAVCALAIDIPRIGFARDAQGRVVAVNGIAGNFVSGEPGAYTEALAWNGSYGIRKTQSTLDWLDESGAMVATFNAPKGAVVIGFGSGQAVWIFSKSERTLCQLKSTQWSLQQVPVALSPDEEVLAVSGGRDSVSLAVSRSAGLFVVTFDLITGARTAEAASPRTASQLLFLADGALAGASGSLLWITQADGSMWSVDTGVTLTGLSWMGRDWVQISADDRQFAVRLGRTMPEAYVLPQAEVVE